VCWVREKGLFVEKRGSGRRAISPIRMKSKRQLNLERIPTEPHIIAEKEEGTGSMRVEKKTQVKVMAR